MKQPPRRREGWDLPQADSRAICEIEAALGWSKCGPKVDVNPHKGTIPGFDWGPITRVYLPVLFGSSHSKGEWLEPSFCLTFYTAAMPEPKLYAFSTHIGVPTDASSAESSVSALRSSISALESSIKILEGASPKWETFGWVCAFVVAIGVFAETSVIRLNPAIRDRVKIGHREWPKT
jgi:hypothetical protein